MEATIVRSYPKAVIFVGREGVSSNFSATKVIVFENWVQFDTNDPSTEERNEITGERFTVQNFVPRENVVLIQEVIGERKE